MYTDWKNYFKQYIPAEEYIPDNISSKSLSTLVFFVLLGAISCAGLIAKVEGKTDLYPVTDITSEKIQRIKEEIKASEIKNTLYESEILILNHTLTQLFQNKEKQEILKLSKLTGMQRETGHGVIVKLLDSNNPIKQNENPNLGIVHNTDLVALVNDLWAGGAKGISINNQRITALTEISCIGPAILVNKTRIVPPFAVKAIGEPEKLVKSLKAGHIKTLELYGIRYSIDEYEKVEIPADGTIILAGEF